MKKLITVLFALLLLFSCQQDQVDDIQIERDYSMRAPLIWNQLYLEVERYTNGYRPPVSARAIAYINLAAYEAGVHGSSRFQSLSSYYDDLDIDAPEYPDEIDWEVAVHHAYDKAFELFFPTAPSQQQFQILEIGTALQNRIQPEVEPTIYQNSRTFGRYVAETIFEWSSSDEWGHKAYLKNTDPHYFPPDQEGLWKPTYPDFLPALLPHWGKVRIFGSNQELETIPPPGFSTAETSQIYQEAVETQVLVNEIKAGQHEEDYWIAEFWSDDCPILTFTPAARWISITNQIIGIEQTDLFESLAVYAKVSMALSDAGVSCWKAKYEYNCLRPIDYIREYIGDSDWNTVMCPDGSGGYYTPNFPSYPSGHASFGGAAAFVLEDFFGTDYRFTDRSHEGRTEFRGAPRTYNSFREAALENAYSRVPLGVHFQADSDAGVELGWAVGSGVRSLPIQ